MGRRHRTAAGFTPSGPDREPPHAAPRSDLRYPCPGRENCYVHEAVFLPCPRLRPGAFSESSLIGGRQYPPATPATGRPLRHLCPRIAAGHHGKDREQQAIGKLIDLSLPTPTIGNFGQQAHRRRKRNHSHLRLGCRPTSQTFADSRILFRISRLASLERCCSTDSLEHHPQR